MAKGKKRGKAPAGARPDRVGLTAAESLKRMQAFAARKEQFIAAIRKGKNRGVSA